MLMDWLAVLVIVILAAPIVYGIYAVIRYPSAKHGFTRKIPPPCPPSPPAMIRRG
jgi:hypothetical protein